MRAGDRNDCPASGLCGLSDPRTSIARDRWRLWREFCPPLPEPFFRHCQRARPKQIGQTCFRAVCDHTPVDLFRKAFHIEGNDDLRGVGLANAPQILQGAFGPGAGLLQAAFFTVTE
jgi:hypothetical protein